MCLLILRSFCIFFFLSIVHISTRLSVLRYRKFCRRLCDNASSFYAFAGGQLEVIQRVKEWTNNLKAKYLSNNSHKWRRSRNWLMNSQHFSLNAVLTFAYFMRTFNSTLLLLLYADGFLEYIGCWDMRALRYQSGSYFPSIIKSRLYEFETLENYYFCYVCIAWTLEYLEFNSRRDLVEFFFFDVDILIV